MNKFSFILLAALTSTSAFANDISVNTAGSTEEANINSAWSLIEGFETQKQEDAIYAYAENVLSEISANAKKEIFDNAELQFEVRLTSL